MSPVDRIHIYQKFHLDDSLLLDSYEHLTTRDEPIGIEEGEKLGLRTSLQIACAREMSRGPDTGGGLRSPCSVQLNGPDLRSLISKVCGLRIHTNGTADPGPFTAPVNTSDRVDRASALPAVSSAMLSVLQNSDGPLHRSFKTAPTTPSKPGSLSKSASTSEDHPPTNDTIYLKPPTPEVTRGGRKGRHGSESRWPLSFAYF